eukprot:TRINITY_DN25581_c0_g1_i1.p1 TRINITY_DN25581_c0_g1~~TRINITY_DN25581_c0_g1_i1.p1  ORF type:complete len:161 (+),score=20.54 TRINITY_DN25581_c0_g1_i1:74-484(+)
MGLPYTVNNYLEPFSTSRPVMKDNFSAETAWDRRQQQANHYGLPYMTSNYVEPFSTTRPTMTGHDISMGYTQPWANGAPMGFNSRGYGGYTQGIDYYGGGGYGGGGYSGFGYGGGGFGGMGGGYGGYGGPGRAFSY